MIKTLVNNELLKSKYFKNATMDSISLAKYGGKVYFNLRDLT